jgi:hypothetical protein
MQETPYAEYRHAAFERTMAEFEQSIPPVHVWLKDIDHTALQTWSGTWAGLHPSGYGAFPWWRIAARYCRRPRNFQVALWSQGILCGLAVGKMARDHSALSLDYLERKQNAPNPLAGDVAGIVTAAAIYYSGALGVPLLEISNPVPELERRYQALGFSLAYNRGSTRYLARTLP